MNDEIKEILDYYQKDIDRYEKSMKNYTEYQQKTTFSKNYQRYKNHKLLLDCITNLQKEVRVNNDLIPHFKNRAKELKKEITNLQKENETLKTANDYLQDKLNELEKATNYNYYHSENVKLRRENSILNDYKSKVEKAVELLKNKKEKYKNMTDYHQYYVEGYDKAIELTHSSHSGIMLETIKSTTIKNCDDLLNILQNGSDASVKD